MSRTWPFLAALVMVGLLVSVGAAGPVTEPPESGTLRLCVGQGCTMTGGVLTGGAILVEPIPIDGETGNAQGTAMLEVGGDQVMGEVAGNVEPIETLGFAATDAGLPSTFAMSLSLPIIPTLTGLASFSLSLVGGCTDGGSNGCAITPFLSAPGISEYFVNGFSLPSLGTRGGAEAVPSPGGTFDGATFGTITGTFDCGAVGGCTSFETLISFTGTGGGDAYAFVSRFQIEAAAPVPEPSTLSLLGLGLLGLGVALWRQRS